MVSRGKGGEDLTHKNTPAKLAGGRTDFSPPKAGGGAGAMPGVMPGKKMRKMKEDVGGAGGGNQGADPGFGQGQGPMGAFLPIREKKKKKIDPDRTFGMEGPVLPKLSASKEGRPSV